METAVAREKPMKTQAAAYYIGISEITLRKLVKEGVANARRRADKATAPFLFTREECDRLKELYGN